jgi:hypothetical protein
MLGTATPAPSWEGLNLENIKVKHVVCLCRYPMNINITRSTIKMKSQDSSVGIATGYRLDDQMVGFLFPMGAGNFSL